MVRNKRISIAKPSLGKEEWIAIKEPIFSGWLTQGPKVKEFEESFAKRHKVKYALAVTNCTTALHIALLAAGIKKGDEVLVPAFTWVATANAVEYCGAKPVFVDIDPDTFNLDPTLIKKKITSKTKAIIPVHLFGLCADIDAIKKAAKGLKIIEDAACASGSYYKGKPSGSLGDLGCFSFHPRKVITTGEGGMVTTKNKKYAEITDTLRNHGSSIPEEKRHTGSKPWDLSEFKVLGFNYRMSDLQGAVGTVQLTKLDRLIKERIKWAEFYKNMLKDLVWLKTPIIPDGYETNWQSFVCMVDEISAPYKRNKIMEILLSHGISTRPGTHAVHMLGYYKKRYNIKPLDYPNSYKADKYSMALPLHNNMSKEDYEFIVNTLHQL